MNECGVVDLRDLRWWSASRAPFTTSFVAAAGLELEDEIEQRFPPPRVVIAIHDGEDDLLATFGSWLAAADHVVPVCVPADQSIDPATAAEALARARALVRSLPVRPILRAVPPTNQIELPLSAWTTYRELRNYQLVSDVGARLWPVGRIAIDDQRSVDLADPPPEIVFVRTDRDSEEEQMLRRTGWQRLGRDPFHPVSWRGARQFFNWIWEGTEGRGLLGADEYDAQCDPARKVLGYSDNDPLEVTLAPAADFAIARFVHDVQLTSAIPVEWQAAGDIEVAVFRSDPRRALFFAREADGLRLDMAALDPDARELAPVVVAGPDDDVRYAIDLHHLVHRIERRGGEAVASEVGGPRAGFAVFDADHRLVRRASGRLLGGWFRWATVEEDGAYFREDLATGARVRIGPVDIWLATDPADESVARDAMLAGRADAALAIHRSCPSRDVSKGLEILSIPGTRNILLVGPDVLRVV